MEKEKSKIFTFYWLTGDREVLEGETPAKALNNAGCGAGALGALDFYAEGDNKEYIWENNKWIKKEVTIEKNKS